MAETDETTTQEPEETITTQEETSPDDEGLKDKHDEPAINRGRYDREMKAKDAEIAELKKQLGEAKKGAADGATAIKRVEALEAQLADKEVTHALETAGCVNDKAAKALLDDYEGDVSKLKEACPYLFKQTKQIGSTGYRPGGAPDALDDRLDRAFGLKK